MEIHLSTALYSKLDLCDAVKRLATIHKYVELSHAQLDRYIMALNTSKIIDEFRCIAEVSNVRIKIMHFPTAKVFEDLLWRDTSRALQIFRSIVEKACSILGVEAVVVHTASRKMMYYETLEHYYNDLKNFNVEFLRKLDAIAQDLGITIGVENRVERWMFGSTPRDLIEVVEGLENVGICYDVGHAHACGFDVVEFLRMVKDKIVVVHVHDNDGSGDQHRPPLTGSIDWFRISEELRYFPIVAEVSCSFNEDVCRNIAYLTLFVLERILDVKQ